MTAFEELGVMPEIAAAVEDMEWTLPTDIQYEAIPLVLGGGDVLMAAETGTGKTGAFCLPVLQIVSESLRSRAQASNSKSAGAADAAAIKPHLNSDDRDPLLAIDKTGLVCQCRDEARWHGVRANIGVVKGKAYFEVTPNDEGLCRFGWGTSVASRQIGTDKHSYGFGSTGKSSHARSFDTYAEPDGTPFGKGDVIGCYLDRESGVVGWSKNGEYLGDAYTLPPQLKDTPLFPAISMKNAEAKVNFGESPFQHPPTHGHVGIASMPASNLAVWSAATLSTSSKRTPLALILEPSRELAQQTRDQLVLFKKHLPAPPVRDVLLIGGVNAKDQASALKSGVDIAVGTPGRVMDMVKNGILDLSQIRFFILDEVDGLLSQGHKECIDTLYAAIPKQAAGQRLQLIVCSATLHSPDVKKLAETIMYHPIWVDLKGRDSVPDTVHHTVVHIDPAKDKWWESHRNLPHDGIHTKSERAGSQDEQSFAVKMLKYKYLLAAIDKHQMDQAIIFCRTKLDCDNVERFLQSQGSGQGSMVSEYSCACVHGDRRVDERRQNLQAFKDGEIRFLICTDVAARGIDVKGIPFVINFTLPDEKENYIHRIGRVGRAERMGLAISLVATVQERVWYHTCPSRGKGCRNTRLLSQGGCTMWYNEPQYLSDIQEHLDTVIPVTDESMAVPTGTFDGKVVYGEKKSGSGTGYEGHAALLAPAVRELGELEEQAQTSFLTMGQL